MEYNKKLWKKSTILKIQDFDSIVKTEEKLSTITDSLLEVKPNIVVKKTYRFSDEKLKSITIDTILNCEEYLKSYNEKTIPFYFYIQDKYYDKDNKEISANIKQYLTEFTTLPVSEQKTIKKYANLQGVYVSDNYFYTELTFRGKKTVSIRGLLTLGIPFATSYELDENYVKIRTEKCDLLLEIKDDKTLIGEGFAEGTYKKQNN